MDVGMWISSTLSWSPRAVLPGGPTIRTSITQGEGRVLQQLARGQRCVEFGAAYGYSTVVMGLVAGRMTSVDPHDGLDDSWDVLQQNLAAYGVGCSVTLAREYSQDWCARPQEPTALLFIDGDHSYGGTLRDLFCGSRLVLPGFVVALHDYNRLPDVRRAADGWARRPPTAIVDSMAIYRM